jgi:hypothetical protein
VSKTETRKGTKVDVNEVAAKEMSAGVFAHFFRILHAHILSSVTLFVTRSTLLWPTYSMALELNLKSQTKNSVHIFSYLS